MDFKQRPFDYVSVQNDLPKHIAVTSLLTFTANPNLPGEFGLLAPSIGLVSPVEVDLPGPGLIGGTLTISGDFGTDPRPDPDSKVTVGGLDCPVRDWQPHVIFCQLPGLESAGDVVVTVRKQQGTDH
ncbi:MAG: IPT/TIG domain-containing protein [Gammaproteobacteria bacterium]